MTLDDFENMHTEFNKRVIPFGNNKINATREDPFGFWKIAFERGPVPEFLRGQYTSFEEAFKDIAVYMKSRKEEPPESATKVVNKQNA